MRTSPVVALSALAILFGGCPSNAPESAVPIEEEAGTEDPAQLLSNLNVADPRAGEHFIRGFHALEQRAWRWTERSFALLLQPPRPVEGRPALLDARFTIPGVVIETVGPVALTARVNGVEVGSETYSKAAENIQFTKEIPAAALTSEPAKIEFELDKAMPASERDPRELGLVALSVALK